MDVLHDNRLSLRAKGLMMMYQSMGEVINSTEMSKIVSEGRDAIRTAMSELTQYGYIEVVRYQTAYGHWQMLHRFTDAWKTEAGFSGDLYSCTAITLDSYSDTAIAVIPNGITAIASGDLNSNSEEVKVSKDPYGFITGEDEPEYPLEHVLAEVKRARKAVAEKRAAKRTPAEEPVAIGQLPDDIKARRQEKYTKTKIVVSKPTDDRHDRADSDWTTSDIVAEFGSLIAKHCPGVTHQLNVKSLASWINQQYGTHQVPRESILKAVRLFFNDPRMIRDAGIGQPLWRRFLAYWPTVQGMCKVTSDVTDDYSTGHTDKMLKLLEG